MRLLVLLAALVSLPASAQVEVRALVNAGYDAGYRAASVGLGMEIGWRPAGSPVALALRPTADVVFVGSQASADPLIGLGDEPMGWPGGSRYEGNVVRVGAEAVARLATLAQVAPYLKAGIVGEYEDLMIGDVRTAYFEPGAVAGAGVGLGRTYVEGTLGFGDASRSRIAVGLRF